MKRIDDDHMPILHLEADELLSRYESLLKACYVKDIRLRVPTPISDAFHETRIEVERRGLSPQVKLPSILDPNDPDPIFHNGRSIVRYLDEPFLSQFFSGLISLRSASEYVIDSNPARRDDEHERPFMYPNQTLTIQGIAYPATKIRLQRQIIGARRTATAVLLCQFFIGGISQAYTRFQCKWLCNYFGLHQAFSIARKGACPPLPRRKYFLTKCHLLRSLSR
jgi:hypothetical protein